MFVYLSGAFRVSVVKLFLESVFAVVTVLLFSLLILHSGAIALRRLLTFSLKALLEL